MTKKLEVVSNFDPAGTQPEAIKSLVSGIDNGLLHQVLLGVTGSGKTYTMAKVIEETQRPAIIMAHNKTLAAHSTVNLEIFFQIILLSILFPTMIIINLRPMSQPQILILLKMHQLMSILSRCDYLRQKH